MTLQAPRHACSMRFPGIRNCLPTETFNPHLEPTSEPTQRGAKAGEAEHRHARKLLYYVQCYHFYPDDGGSILPRNVSAHVQEYTLS
jgi:hypothetical protein